MTEIFFCDRKDYQLVFLCPKCKRKHFHGLGNGFRSPHCFSSNGFKEDYYLIEKIKQDDEESEEDEEEIPIILSMEVKQNDFK